MSSPELIAGQPREAASVLETRHLSRRVGPRTLVDDVNVQIARGEIVAVVGPSGAGKSSFLRLLNRLDEPTSGAVLLNGTDCRCMAPQELRRRVGMVMQTAYLFPGTVAANIAFGPQQRGEALPREGIAALLARVGLAGFADRDIGHLSGGEAQRVALARTLANAPEVLLLDEPTSALDPELVNEVLEVIRRLAIDDGLTMIISTHQIRFADEVADRVAFLTGGVILEEGPAHEVLSNPHHPLTARFLSVMDAERQKEAVR